MLGPALRIGMARPCALAYQILCYTYVRHQQPTDERTDEMSEIKALTNDTYAEVTGSGAVVVDFYADWCGPCKMMAPIFVEVADEYDGKVTFCKLNIDENRETAMANQVMSIPTLLFFKDGEVKDRVTGAIDKATLTGHVDSLL
jgi:thioredoxin 1